MELTDELVSGMEVTAVLTVRRDDMLLFEGQNLKLAQFKEKAMAYLKGREKAALLVRLDPSIRAQTVFDIFGQAKQAGFSNVLVAGEKSSRRIAHLQLKWGKTEHGTVTEVGWRSYSPGELPFTWVL